MENEIKKNIIKEKIILENRQKLYINGIEQVISIKDDLLQIKTKDGGLIITGSDLQIEKLNLDTGDVEVMGKINSLKYSNVKKESFFRKIFK